MQVSRFLFLLAGALALAACSKPAPTEEPIRSVKLMTVQLEAMESGAEFAGDVRARVESRLGFRVGGKLVRRPAEVGQRVQAGAVLAQLDPQDFKLATEAVQAQLASVVTQRDLAAADVRRYRELKEQNFISGIELDRREATLKAAEAQVNQVRAQLTSQANQGSYTTLVADQAGTVIAVDAEPGQVVAAGAPVVRLAQDGPRDVVFAVPEDRVGRMRVGSAVDVVQWSSGTRLQGQIREVAAVADPVTRTFQVKVGLGPKDQPPLGSTVTVRPSALSAQGLPVIRVPTSALKRDPQGSAVWVFDPATSSVRSQLVEVQVADGNLAVVSKGLTPGVQVVTAGVHVLSPGQKVRAYRATGDVAASPQRAASGS